METNLDPTDPVATEGGTPENTGDDTTKAPPQVPHLDHNPETPEEVQALANQFADYRKEVAALRQELALQRRGAPTVTAPVESLEDRLKKRLAQIAEHSHYCPGCGKLYDYPQRCEGSPAAPHPLIEVVSTDELGQDADPANHTAAPPSEAGVFAS